MVGQEDLERIVSDYTDEDDNLTVEDVREDLEQAGFDDFDSFGDVVDQASGFSDVVESEQALQQAQQQAIESLSDAGAVGGEIVRAEDGFTAIGAPQNVEQRIERTGPESGDVIARNVNTGTEGVIGQVELAPDPGGS
jgi:phage-related baseplate assembly protein